MYMYINFDLNILENIPAVEVSFNIDLLSELVYKCAEHVQFDRLVKIPTHALSITSG